jgi:hypothetical protein
MGHVSWILIVVLIAVLVALFMMRGKRKTDLKK